MVRPAGRKCKLGDGRAVGEVESPGCEKICCRYDYDLCYGETMQGYMTVAEAAAELGVRENTITRRVRTGRMKAERVGARGILIPEAEVARWREIGRLPPGPPPEGDRNGLKRGAAP